MDRKQFRDLAEPETAREAIASLDLTPEPERVPLREARGRVLAERIDADLDVPGFDRASVDGYALRAADTFGADEADPRNSTVSAWSTPGRSRPSMSAPASARKSRPARSSRRGPTPS